MKNSSSGPLLKKWRTLLDSLHGSSLSLFFSLSSLLYISIYLYVFSPSFILSGVDPPLDQSSFDRWSLHLIWPAVCSHGRREHHPRLEPRFHYIIQLLPPPPSARGRRWEGERKRWLNYIFSNNVELFKITVKIHIFHNIKITCRQQTYNSTQQHY